MVIPRSRLFWSVSISHLVIDIFNASVPVLLTFIAGHILALTNTQIGFAISAYQFTAAISQPFAGWLADRTGGRWLGSLGVAWTVGFQTVGLLMAAVTREYLFLLLPLALAALGSGAFHPVGALHASDSSRTATRDLSIFFFMGQFGGGIGPALTGLLLDSAASRLHVFTAPLGGLEGRLLESGSVAPLFVLAIASLPAILFMARTVPDRQAYHSERTGRPAAAARRLMLAPLLILAGVVMLRGLVNPGLVAFLPRLFQSYGWTPAEYGLLSSSYWIAGAFAGLVAGGVAQRYGARPVIALTLLTTAPAVFFLGTTSSPFAFVLAIAVGALSGSSHSLIVSQTQRYMPAGKGLAAGAGLGFIFGMGALGTLAIGALSDALGGIPQAFQVVAGVTVVTGLLALALPRDREG